MDINNIKAKEKLIIENDKLIYYMKNSNVQEFDMSKLTKISVLTTALGPIYDDVALAMFFNEVVLILTSTHYCYSDLYDDITKRVSINYEEYIKAMSSVENAEFILWEL